MAVENNNNSTLDLVVFGASGFTGKRVVKELVDLLQSNDNEKLGFSFGIAGRSPSKLKEILSQICTEYPRFKPDSISIIEADVNDASSLDKMAADAKILLNCVGPYSLYGEPVVKACIDNSTDYIDISGEPQFIENIYYKYHQEALAKKTRVISACGFDSVPSDMGVLYAISQCQFPLHSLECFIETRTQKAHYTTFESAVYGFSNRKALGQLRQKIGVPKAGFSGPKTPKRLFPFYDARMKKWAVSFPGSDSSVVKRTLAYLASSNKKTQLKTLNAPRFFIYFTTKSLFQMIALCLFGLVFTLMTSFEFGRKLLLRFPEFFSGGTFSRQGPSEQDMAKSSFKMTFFGSSANEGSKTTSEQVVTTTRVFGPDPGYITTPICMVQAGMCLLENKVRLHNDQNFLDYGVLTAGSVFGGTNYIERLEKRGIKFQNL